MITATERTQEEITDLKRQWCNDPMWDIYDTEGFEAHRDELMAYQEEMEAYWARERDKEHIRAAERFGVIKNYSCPDAVYAVSVGRYIEQLEHTIAELERRIEALEER